MLTHHESSRDRAERQGKVAAGDGLSDHYFPTLRLVLGFAVLLLIAVATGCVRRQDSHDGVLNGDGDFTLVEFTFDNARFEPVDQGIHPFTGRYWIRKGEDMALRWDTAELHWQSVDLESACPFVDNTTTDDCQVCDACEFDKQGWDITGAPCWGTQPVLDHPEAIVSLKNFFPDSMPKVIGGLTGLNFLSGCAHKTNPVTIEPAEDATYQLRLPLKIPVQTSPITVVAEKEIHVIEAPGSTKTAYQLTSAVVDGRQYWSWSTESIASPANSDAFWGENFSRTLHVSEVRVFKGTCQYDPNTGICEHFFEAQQVRPSRVQFIPNFTGSISTNSADVDHRCYQDPAKLDFISLDNCRLTFNPNSTQSQPWFVTPTFVPGHDMEKLTWFVEFNTGEGGDGDLSTPCNLMTGAGCEGLDPSEQLIIELTIVAS